MSNKIRHIFFELLRMGLWGKGSLSTSDSLSDEDWAVLYRYARNHTVEGVLFDGLSLLAEDQQPPRSLRIKWAVRVDQIERHNERMSRVTAGQFAYFVKEDIEPVLLKGQGVANCYPNPLHRMSGDIDWYFEGDKYDTVRKRLLEKKIVIDDALDFTLGYDWRGIHIEHHRRLFDISSLFSLPYLKTLEETYRGQQQSITIAGQPVTLLAPELQIVQVNVHILKHLLAFGIGLRQICDAAMLYVAYKDKIDTEQLYRIYKRLGILNWVQVLHGVLVKYVGMPKEALPFPYPEKLEVDWMLEEIWQSGNFGFHDERFAGGDVSFVSKHPGGARRLWHNLRLYFKYAPQEVIFFPVRRATARIAAKFFRKS